MAERRGRRVALDRSGRIEDGGGGSHSCIVQDISATGARVLVPQADDLPEAFTLTLEPGGDRWACRVVWWRLGELGIAFA